MEDVPRANRIGTRRSLRSDAGRACRSPAFTPAYDHELAARARAGAEVEPVTSRFRFGRRRCRRATRARALLSSLVSRLSPLAPAAAVEVAEHPFGLVALRARRADVCTCSGSCRARRPPLQAARPVGLHRPRSPAAADGAQAGAMAPLHGDSIASSCTASADVNARRAGVDATVIPHPSFQAIQSSATTATRCSASGSFALTRGSPTRSRLSAAGRRPVARRR